MAPSHLYQQNIDLLREGARLAARLETAALGPVDDQSGVGAHFRHCADCYGCFMGGLESAEGVPAVDYDARNRDAGMERSPAQAAAALDDLAARLARIAVDTERPVRVKIDSLAEGSDDTACWQSSTVGRELQFLISHTIHHYALIALLLRRQQVDPGDDFGVAPATLAHRCAVAECAP